MAVSNLTQVSVLAHTGNYTKGRSTKIRCITVHHMAGILSAKACGDIFAREGRRGSSHYGIGNDGQIGNYVDENDTAWTNSNWAANCESVTVEVSNSALGGDYPVSDAAFESLVKLVADIAKRNNLGMLVPGQNLTWHSMFVATSCPGNYQRSKMQELADRVNTLNSIKPVETSKAPTKTNEQIADEILAGQGGWGNWPEREVRLKAAGYDYATVQNIVNQKAKGTYSTPASTKKTNDQIADEVIAGKWDKAPRRYELLKNAGYDAQVVQNIVNAKCNGTYKPSAVSVAIPSAISSIGVGNKVTPITYIAYNGVRLRKTRDYYFVSSISGERVVLRADSQNGVVYAAFKKSNLKKV